MRKTKIIFLAVGILILAVLFKTFGVETTISHIREIGWRFWLTVLICLANNIFLTCSWKVLINYPLKKSHFFKLLLARIAGDTTSSISSLGAMAGEPLKAMFLKDIIPLNVGLASVIMDRTVHIVTNTLLILTGIVFSFFFMDIPMYVSFITLGLFLVFLWTNLLLLKKQRDGFLEFVLNRLLPKRVRDRLMNEQRWGKVKTLDAEISAIFSSRDNLNHFYVSLAIRYVSILITGTLEIYLILKYIGAEVSPVNAFFVYIFGLFFTGAIFFMPANIGTSEGSYSLVLKLLGYDPVLGLSVGIIRRLRTFVWSGIGLVILFYAGLLKKEKSADKA